MAYEIKILRQRYEAAFDTDGKPFERIAVDFKVGEDGPFTEHFPRENYDGAAARARLETFAGEIRKARGEPF